ncbi:hypothetical protein MNBD_NITROSPINAE01-602 [hydrothermal vent metagenome]|uniref:Uncharacterized protein n=1 Tax=hydrothermal vent metagenome TaxID=652676 RepID=A0A3B1BZ04_9ZZZZ
MQLKFHFPVNRSDSFNNFLLDKANSNAVSLCRAFANASEGQTSSIVLYGESGSGKTHLLSAIGKVISEKLTERATLYLDANALKEKIDSLKTYTQLKEYLEKYEHAAYLAIDNLDAICGIRKAEEQVFHLYNAVTQGGGRFAATLISPPAAWNFSLPDLSTRLLWGQVIELRPVGDEKRGAVLIKTAKEMGMTLPQTAAEWLITRLPRDPASQRETLVKIDQFSLTYKRKVSIQLIREALEYGETG